MNTILAKNNWLSELDDLFLRENVGSAYHLPATNILESEKAYTLNLVAPGFEKSDFKIEMEKDLISISTNVKSESNDTNEKFTRKEFRLKNFKRSFKLPKNTEVEEVSANYENGILKIKIPKKNQELIESKRLIEIA
ncbi:MAG: Hsp20/alpha crystallin family protein [Flavobacteriaceae bacterium]|nr:Hsp20/alpha crystallin family protein [Flavobacteriaceae bacterium]